MYFFNYFLLHFQISSGFGPIQPSLAQLLLYYLQLGRLNQAKGCNFYTEVKCYYLHGELES